MLLFLAVSYLATTTALPVASVPNESPESLAYNDIDSQRKLNDIVWSSIVTIFACTWLTLHPNIPPPIYARGIGPWGRYLSAIKRFTLYRLQPFVVALIAPEWILAWAVQQRVVANQVAKQGGSGWTRTHGFFILMGGFHAFTRNDDEKPQRRWDYGTSCYPLDQETVRKKIDQGELELPPVEELQDRTRQFAHLPLSELEVVTLAYTILSIAIYTVWWDKPRNIDRPIRVYIAKDVVQETMAEALRSQDPKGDWTDSLCILFGSLVPGNLRRTGDHPLAGMTSVPMFYSGKPNNRREMLPSVFVSSGSGAVFGAIHCLAWSYSFSSSIDQLLWRVSTIVMIAIPALAFVTGAIAILDDKLERIEKSWPTRFLAYLVDTIGAGLLCIVVFIGPFLYLAARVVSFLLAFKTLASLPNAAFHTIPWTKWIPHI
ncbi:hypothetical protein CPB86DRAFT_830297 [Serendipita vermifera]|nr:hypothetical protein CPB86DRAFT_830297 [Serendipita vermifera]